MSLEDVLEDFLSYKKVLDDLDRNETESSTVETYEKQFMVRNNATCYCNPGSTAKEVK